MKRIPLFLLLIPLLVAACSPAASPVYAPEGGPFYGGAEPDYGGVTADDSAAPPEFARDAEQAQAAGETVERLVIKNATLSIAVEDPLTMLDDIIQLADELGGFVVTSDLYYTKLEDGTEVPRANVTIRVPADLFEDAIAEIEAGAGEPLSKNITGQDVTNQYTDLQSRLRNLEAAEAQLQSILEEATKTEDVLAVFNQLVYTREQIELIKGQMQYFEQSAAFSAITVDILADEAVRPVPPLSIGGWQPVGVARDALQTLIDTLQVIGNALIWLILYVLPVLLVLYLLVLAARLLFRQRKKAKKVDMTDGEKPA